MLGEHHDLGKEFPEYKDKIHQLKTSNRHFSHLFDEYQKVNKEIYRIEEQIETTSDTFAEELKSKRVKLKDELIQMLKSSK
jgi:uncharacterized protein YdcH (DUF465 family)